MLKLPKSYFVAPKFVSAFLFVALVGTMQTVSAKVSELSVLTDFVQNFDSMSARFEQTLSDDVLLSQPPSKGFLLIKRPGKLRWVYEKPEPQQIVVDGTNLWLFDEDLEQVSVRSLADLGSDFPLYWLLYKTPLQNRFNIIAGDEVDGVSWFNLAPKTPGFFQSLDVAIKAGQLQQVWMYQGQDSLTKVRFLDVEFNLHLDDREFKFDLPEGVDLIGGESAP